MSKHLILGGGGFIGSHLAKRLCEDGNSVTTVDIKHEKFRWSQLRGMMCNLKGDLRYPGYIEAMFENNFNKWSPPDFVWQLAADMGGVEYFHSEHDWQAAVNNQMINVNVMDAVAKYAPDARVIFTSTACALATEKQTHHARELFTPQTWEWHNQDPSPYWMTNKWQLTEDDIYWGTPDQLYGQEKRNSAILWKNAPVDTRVSFLHTVYGPYQEHAGIRMKFPSAVAQKARKARETGTIELLGDGRQVRTYLYIDDAVDRLLALGASDQDPGFVNIGGTTPYTVDEVAVIAANAAGHGGELGPYGYLDFVHIPGPTGVEARAADMTKFNKAFPELAIINDPAGLLAPDVVSLEEGMKRFIDWLDEVDPL